MDFTIEVDTNHLSSVDLDKLGDVLKMECAINDMKSQTKDLILAYQKLSIELEQARAQLAHVKISRSGVLMSSVHMHPPPSAVDNGLTTSTTNLTTQMQTIVSGDDGTHNAVINGVKTWTDKEGRSHRDDDLPAEIWPTGTVIWYCHGKRHRVGPKPATYYWNGSHIVCEYQQNGLMHRDEEEGPAVFDNNGLFAYYWNGKLHRNNGPAKITLTELEWWSHGRFIRSVRIVDL